MHGKRKLGVEDLAYVFNMSPKSVKLAVEQGEAHMRNALLLLSLLDRVRQNSDHKHTCEHCGVLRSTAGPCLNRMQCDKRKALVTPLLQRAPLDIPELAVTRTDVFRLLRKRREVNKYLKSLSGDAAELRFGTLLRLTPQELTSLRELETLI